jgi:cysteine desulfurase
MSPEVYLDWNATALLDPSTIEYFGQALTRLDANPHSQHRRGREASVAVERVRESIAELLNVRPKQIRFTSGATESNSWLLSHFSNQSGVILGSSIEHPAVGAWLDERVPVHASGIVDMEFLEKRLQQGGVALVSIMAANNETGVLQPVSDIHELCQRYDTPYHCDAAQIFNRIDWVGTADFITLSGHKMGAPVGVGALVISQELPPLLKGGAQERGGRAGTVNAPLIATWGHVLSQVRRMDASNQQLLESALLQDTSAQIVGALSPRLPNTTLALFDVPGDMIVMALDMQGIAVSTGSACSSASSKDSFVLEAMGLTGKPVRFSWGHGTDVSSVIPTIVETIQNLEQTCEW